MYKIVYDSLRYDSQISKLVQIFMTNINKFKYSNNWEKIAHKFYSYLYLCISVQIYPDICWIIWILNYLIIQFLIQIYMNIYLHQFNDILLSHIFYYYSTKFDQCQTNFPMLTRLLLFWQISSPVLLVLVFKALLQWKYFLIFHLKIFGSLNIYSKISLVNSW